MPQEKGTKKAKKRQKKGKKKGKKKATPRQKKGNTEAKPKIKERQHPGKGLKLDSLRKGRQEARQGSRGWKADGEAVHSWTQAHAASDS